MPEGVTLHLSTGHQFKGKLIGAPIVSSGELVFSTGMVGYSEAITDPSYFGQILTFTYPLIGNYGVPEHLENEIIHGHESKRIQLSGVIICEDFELPHHRILSSSISKWLKENNIPGITGLDTRELTQLIRDNGKILAKIIPDSPTGSLNRHKINYTENIENLNSFFDPSAQNALPEVSTDEVIEVGNGKLQINVVDCGVKWNIVRELAKRNATVRVLPWDSDFKSYPCDGWVISNGPGDPLNTGNLIQNVKKILNEKKPTLGICLGHQLMALASGAKTERLPYGHRSHNQPVKIYGSMKGFITSQNHGFTVVNETIPSDWKVWFENINDGSIEGLIHTTLPFFTAQFHPEASSGPNDTAFIFDKFFESIEKGNN